MLKDVCPLATGAVLHSGSGSWHWSIKNKNSRKIEIYGKYLGSISSSRFALPENFLGAMHACNEMKTLESFFLLQARFKNSTGSGRHWDAILHGNIYCH